MGDPKKQRKKYKTPRFAWRTDTLQAELKLLGQYGLRNKRELWRHETMLSRFRENARSLLGKSTEERAKPETQLLERLKRLGILSETAVIDDVLDLSIEDFLERRLQTMVFNKGLAKSIYQARQFISHGHVTVDNHRVKSPSYLVLRDEEAKITYAPTSGFNDANHPMRQILQAEKPKLTAATPRDKNEEAP
jgi:small subunit ribosomal protein S4